MSPALPVEKESLHLQSSFNQRARRPAVSAHLVPLDRAEVIARHARAQARITALVNEALPKAPKNIRKIAIRYCAARERMRLETTAQHLTEKMAAGKKEILQDLHRMNKEYYSVTQMCREQRKFYNGSDRKPGRMLAEKVFGKTTRLYFDLVDESRSPVEPFVTRYLKEQLGFDEVNYNEGYAVRKTQKTIATNIRVILAGPQKELHEQYQNNPAAAKAEICAFLDKIGYKEIDYTAGTAIRYKETTERVKIGKILSETNGPLYDAYRDDFTRMGDGMMVVISRSSEDISRGSFNRGWGSCRSSAQVAANTGIREHNIGVITAYLVRDNDPDILDPLARINLKPYTSLDKETAPQTVFLAFNPIGLHHPGFVDAVNKFADTHFNKDKYGAFHLAPGCESYRELQVRHRLPEEPLAALDQLGLKHSTDENGTIHVHDNLNLSGYGLNRLPDFRDVVVHGEINVSKNKIVTLDGLPEKADLLSACKTLVSSFDGAPSTVKSLFDYRDNAYLITTLGAPSALQYAYGNAARFGDKKEYANSNTCIGPLEEPERFPGFRRKVPKK